MSEKTGNFWNSATKTAAKITESSSRAALKKGAEACATAASKVRDLVSNPEILADLVIAATAAQEQVNDVLRDRRSRYRVGDVQITLGLPPEVSFSISRIGDGSAESSTDLIEAAEEECDEALPPPPPPPPIPNAKS